MYEPEAGGVDGACGETLMVVGCDLSQRMSDQESANKSISMCGAWAFSRLVDPSAEPVGGGPGTHIYTHVSVH